MISATVWGMVALRTSALAAALAGDTRLSDRLYTLADLAEAGLAVEEDMARVAEILKSRDVTADDLHAVLASIQEKSARIQATAPKEEPPQ